MAQVQQLALRLVAEELRVPAPAHDNVEECSGSCDGRRITSSSTTTPLGRRLPRRPVEDLDQEAECAQRPQLLIHQGFTPVRIVGSRRRPRSVRTTAFLGVSRKESISPPFTTPSVWPEVVPRQLVEFEHVHCARRGS